MVGGKKEARSDSEEENEKINTGKDGKKGKGRIAIRPFPFLPPQRASVISVKFQDQLIHIAFILCLNDIRFSNE